MSAPLGRTLLVVLLCAALAGCSVPPPPTEDPPAFVQKWGSYGPNNGQFSVITGVAADGNGNVYATDSAHDRVQKFTSAGVFVTAWGSYGTAPGQFKFPTGIALDAAGNVYVLDSYNYRVQKFTPAGAFVATWGSYGTADGQFKMPRGLAVDPSGNVFVSDAMSHRVQKFTSAGAFVSKWGGYGSGDGQFKFPRGVAADASGFVYVADFTNDRVQKFDGHGAFVGKWGQHGTGAGQFDKPYAVAVDADGDVFVTDTYNDRTQKFTHYGAFLSEWGTQGNGNGQFHEPYGIASDGPTNIFVVDGVNERIEKFGYPIPNSLTVAATLDGAPWAGPLAYVLTGAQSFTGATAPATHTGAASGSYTIAYASGGPAGATYLGATPASQSLATGATTEFLLAFESPTNVEVKATLNGAPWTGLVTYQVNGYADITNWLAASLTYPGAMAPQTFANVLEGTQYVTIPGEGSGYAAYYSLNYLSGGPVGATLASVTSPTSTFLLTGHTKTYTLNFLAEGVDADSLVVNATLDGAPWSGPMNAQLQGLLSMFPSVSTPVYVLPAVPHVFTGVQTAGSWTDPVTQVTGPGGFYGVTYLSGGPANAVLDSTTPSFPAQTFVTGSVKTFTFHFRSIRPTTGEIGVNATLDGAPWTGAVSYTLTGPASLAGTLAPQGFAAQPPGAYSIAYNSGGPPGATFAGVVPSITQSMAPGGSIGYTLAFRTAKPAPVENGTIVIEATLANAMGAAAWVGSVNYTITGPYLIGGASVPQTNAGVPVGAYTLTYQSGGPPGTSLVSVTPSATQTLSANGAITFRLNFR